MKIIESIALHANLILRCLPKLAELLNEGMRLAKDKRWKVLRESTATLEGPLVVTFFGPSGAGKSTLFRLLTGIEVPAGTNTKPCTYQCLLAVPDSFDEATLQAHFPGMELRRLESLGQLRDKSLPPGVLFFSRYQADAKGDALLLADVPDCNTTALENWARAELLIERAEVVIFVTSRHHYANQSENEYLARVCGLAGHLALIVTMADREAAREIWQHLISNLIPNFCLKPGTENGEPQQPFSAKRSDGTTRVEFLTKADVYFSPESKSPALADVNGIEAGIPPLAKFLTGRDLEQIRISKHRNAQEGGLTLARELLQSHAECTKALEKAKQETESEISNLDIIGDSVPIGETLGEMSNVAEGCLPKWMRYASVPLKIMAIPLNALLKVAKGLIEFFRKKPELAKELSRDATERRQLLAQADRLLESWRKRLPDLIQIDADACREAKQRLSSSELPPPDSEWRSHLQDRTRQWVRDHEWKAFFLLRFTDVIGFLATTLIALDISITGGVLTFHLAAAHSVPATTIGGSVAGGLMDWLAKFVAKFSLGGGLKEIFADWKKRRNAQLNLHFRKDFADPLVLNPIGEKLNRLNVAPSAEVHAAEVEMTRLLCSLDKTISHSQ